MVHAPSGYSREETRPTTAAASSGEGRLNADCSAKDEAVPADTVRGLISGLRSLVSGAAGASGATEITAATGSVAAERSVGVRREGEGRRGDEQRMKTDA